MASREVSSIHRLCMKRMKFEASKQRIACYVPARADIREAKSGNILPRHCCTQEGKRTQTHRMDMGNQMSSL